MSRSQQAPLIPAPETPTASTRHGGGGRSTRRATPAQLASLVMATARSDSGRWRGDQCSDVELLAAASCDPEAFGVFYASNVGPLLAYFWSRTRDRDVASDLTAETFAAALAGVTRYDPAKGTP